MKIHDINRGQYTVIAIGVILISALLLTTLRLYFWIRSETMPILNKAAAGTVVNVSEMQSLFTSVQKTVIFTYFILSGFVLAIVIAGFVFLRDKVYKNKITDNYDMDNEQEPLHESNAFAEAAVTADASDMILSRLHKYHIIESDLKIPTHKPIVKGAKRKITVLVLLVLIISSIYILYNVLAPSYYKAMAYKMQETGRYSEAVSLYDKAIKINSKSPEMYYGKGFSLSKSGNYKEAVECYSKAISLKPKYYEAYYNKAIALAILKESDNALYNFDMAVKLEPNKIQTYEAKGQLLEELKRYDKALECYKTIYDLDPNYKDIKAKIEKLSSGKAPAPAEPVVMYEPQTGTVLDSTVFRVLVNGKQQIALTGKNKALNYAVSHFTGNIVIKSVDDMYSEDLFITGSESESITIRPDAYKLTVKDRLVISGRAQVFENKFEACLMDNAGSTILRFGVNIKPAKEDGEGPFTIDIPVDRKKITGKSGYLALIQEVIDDGSRVGIIRIPVKFE